MAKKKFAKYLPKVGSAAVVAMAMTVALSTQVSAADIDENDLLLNPNPPADETDPNAAVSTSAIEPAAVNEAVEQSNSETASENQEVVENNEQIQQENNTAAENNEEATGGELPNPDLQLPDAPEVPNTDGIDAADHNEAIGEYNENVDGYNEAVGEYNQGVDDYNEAADAHDQQAQEKYEEEQKQYEEDKAAHEEAEKQYEEDKAAHDQATEDYKQYEEDLKKYEEEQKQYEEDLKQYEEVDKPAYDQAVEDYKQYEEDLKKYDEDYKQYEDDLKQYEEVDKPTYDKAVEDYKQYEEDLKQYNEDLQKYNYDMGLYNAALEQYGKDSKAYNDYLIAKDNYDKAYKAYQEKMTAYTADMEQYAKDSKAYEDYLIAKKEYDDAKAAFDKEYANYTIENTIYVGVNNYNQLVELKNGDIELKNTALENDLHADAAANIGAVGSVNTSVSVDPSVLNTLKDYEALAAQHKALMDQAAALKAHTGKNQPLGSDAYAAYLAAVEAYNDQVAEFNAAAETYNNAVDTYNAAVEAYNKTLGDSSSSTINTGTSTGTADWGNIIDKDFGHIDVKYAAAASKDVKTENGVTTYSDSVTQYTVTGVYTNEESAKKNPNSFGVSYQNGTGQLKTQGMHRYEAYDEFHGNNINGISLDRDTGKISFYVTLLDKENKSHGITVNLDGTSTYAKGSYYKVDGNDKLHLYEDSTGKGLTTVKIGNDYYYDISGKSIFVISALTCDGMSSYGYYGKTSLNPWGLDLVLNLQTMIEIHQAKNANKLSYTGYELGKTAQNSDSAPVAPEFKLEEPTEVKKPDEPTKPNFTQTEPTKVNKPTEPTKPTPPKPVDEVDKPGQAPTKPTPPKPVEEVNKPGEAPKAPNKPTPIEEVSKPGEAPKAPTAPTAPDVVEKPGDAPVDPGKFSNPAPEAPASTGRLNHVATLEKLTDKYIIIFNEPEPEPIPEPIPVSLDDDYPIYEIPDEDVPLADQPVIEILDEDVPLADAPETGDVSFLWGLMSALSAGGFLGLNRKRKKEE